MKDKLIWCNTKEKLVKVVAKLKKDGYSVANVDWMWHSRDNDVTLRLKEKRKDTTFASKTWYKENGYGDAITADEFLGEKKRPSIVIFRRDRNVIAKNTATGDEEVAKCSPDDEFCFKTGAAIALARLMAKTPEVLTDDVRTEWKKALGIEDIPARADHRFNVGDYVTLKEGLTADKVYGGLELLQGAMYGNAHNQRMKVVRVDWANDSDTYYYECKGNSQFTYHYSEEMLDKWDESKIHEGDTVKVVNTGLNYSSYAQWVGKHISDPYMAARFCFGSPSLDEKYKVIKIAEHESNHIPLAYIEQIDGIGFNKCYLIEVKGLEKV